MAKRTSKSKAIGTNEKAPSEPTEKIDCKAIKKKRRFRGKKKLSPDQPTDELKKTIANFRQLKDTPSSNWQAFLASGLAHSDKRNKKKTKGIAQNVPASGSDTKLFHRKGLKKCQNANANVTTEAPPLSDDMDDPYVSELIPKSDESKQELTRCIAIDCEMVGVDDGRESVLARVSLVNQHGECIYDRFVKPKEKVADYRTHVSGVRPTDLKRGEEFETVQKAVAKIIKGRVLVGHAIRNDLKVLMMSHPPKMIRDTSRFRLFRDLFQGRLPSLKKLASQILGVNIQSGEHSSVEDAKATMQLYNLYQKEWEGHRQQLKKMRKKNAAIKGKEHIKPLLQKKEAATSLSDEFAAF